MRESSSITLESDTRRTDQRKTKGPKAGQGTLVTKLKLTRRFLYILLLPEEPSVINKLFKGFFFGSEAYRVTGTPKNYVLFYGIESPSKRKVRTTTVKAKRSPSYWDKEL